MVTHIKASFSAKTGEVQPRISPGESGLLCGVSIWYSEPSSLEADYGLKTTNLLLPFSKEFTGFYTKLFLPPPIFSLSCIFFVHFTLPSFFFVLLHFSVYSLISLFFSCFACSPLTARMVLTHLQGRHKLDGADKCQLSTRFEIVLDCVNKMCRINLDIHKNIKHF